MACHERARAYLTRRVLVPFGDDFKFQDAALQFSNMDRIVRRINMNATQFGVNVTYSTLSEYFVALHADAVATGTTFPLFRYCAAR